MVPPAARTARPLPHEPEEGSGQGRYRLHFLHLTGHAA